MDYYFVTKIGLVFNDDYLFLFISVSIFLGQSNNFSVLYWSAPNQKCCIDALLV